MYNKNKLKKENEKKILKKRKKQWVVVSAATFLLLGNISSGVIMPALTIVQAEEVNPNSSDTENDKYSEESSNENVTADSKQEKEQGQQGSAASGAVGTVAESSATPSNSSDGATAGLNDAKNLLDNQAASSNDTEYSKNYNLAYKGFVDGTNYNSNRDGSSYDNLRGDSTDTTQQVYKDAYQQGKSYFDSTAYRLVRTPNQFRNAYKSSATRQILVMNNISLWSLSGTYGFSTNAAGLKYANQAEQMIDFSNTDITINGRQKTVDYANYSFRNTATNIKMLMKDIIMFGGNWYGPTKSDSSGSITYDNISYTGPQLINADNMSVTIDNQVIVNGGRNYKPKQQTGIVDSAAPDYVASQGNIGDVANPDTGSNQENMEVTNLTFTAGSHYIGSTFNSTALSVKNNGKVVLEQGAIVDLKPKGDGTSGASSSPNGIAYGIYMPTNGSMTVKENAQINITPEINTDMQKLNTNGYKNLAGAFYLGTGDVTLARGSQFNVVLDGPLSPNSADRNVVYIGGTMTLNAGKFSVVGQNLRTNNNTLVNVTGQLNANDLSTVNISAAGTGDVTLVQGAGMSINSPSTVGATFDIQGMQNSRNSKLFSGSNDLTSKNVSVNTGSGFVPYSSISFPMNGGDATGSNMNGQNQKAFTYSNASGSQTKYMQFLAIPDFTFNQDMKTAFENGKYVLKGTMQTIASNTNYNNEKDAIFLRLEDKSSNVVGTATISNTENKNDSNKYQQKVNSTSTDNTNVPYTIELPSNITPDNINNYQIRGAYVISNKIRDVRVDKNQYQEVINQKKQDDVNAGVEAFKNNRGNVNYDIDSDAQYKSNADYKLGYDAAKSGYENANSKTTDYNNGTQSYKDAYDKGQQLKKDDTASQQAKISAKASEVKDNIQKDNTLTQVEKDKQKEAVDSAAQIAKDKIAEAPSKIAADLEIDKGKAEIEKQYTSGIAIDNQKAEAKEEIAKTAADTKALIDTDNTLSNAQKKQQKEAVDTEAANAKSNIDNAISADGINTARDDGNRAIQSKYLSKTEQEINDSLKQQKEAAKQELANQVTEVTNKIDADNTLSTAEKTNQQNAATKAKEDAERIIDNAKNAQSIVASKEDGISKIKNSYTPGATITDQKATAKQEIDKTAADTKALIDADKTLNNQQKKQQKNAIDNEVTEAKSNIDKAISADSINKARDDGKTAIQSKYSSKTEQEINESLQQQKEAAKQDLVNQLTEVTNKIDTDNTLSTAEKTDQKTAATKAKEDAELAISASENAQSIVASKEEGISKIKNSYNSGTSIEDQKTAAKQDVNAKAADLSKKIGEDSTLNNEEKTNQIKAIADEARKAREVIDSAIKADDINKARDDGKANMKYAPGDSIENQQKSATAEIEAQRKSTEDAIKNDKTLTSEQQQAQADAANNAAAKATEDIKKAQNAQSIITLKEHGKITIQGSHLSGTPVNDQKAAAKQEIDKTAADTKALIDADKTLNNLEKKQKKDAIDAESSKAKSNIEQATIADSINKARDDGNIAIQKHYEVKTQEQIDADFKKLQETATKEIEAQQTSTVNAIKEDKTLTSNQQQAQIDAANTAAQKAKTDISNVQNAQSIITVKEQGKIAIQGSHSSATPLSDQKTSAKQDVNAKSAEIIKKIGEDPTLNNEEKTNQIKAVSEEARKAREAIDSAVKADDVNKARDDGKANMKYTPGDLIENQRTAAKAAIEAQQTSTVNAIKDDKTLTSEQQQIQTDAANDAAKKATKDIDKAQNAQSIKTVKEQGIITIANKYVRNNMGIDEQKQAAKDAIEQKEKEILSEIEKDSTLNDSEKADAAKKVSEKANQVKKAIDTEGNADGINSAKNNGIDEISRIYTPKSDNEITNEVNSQKEEVKRKLDGIANATKDKINKDATLTQNERNQQTRAVDDATKTAKNNIDKATDKQTIENAYNSDQHVIEQQYKPSKSIETQRQAAKDAIEQKEKEILSAIEKDVTLDDNQKADLAAKVSGEAITAKNEIDGADNADAINKVKDNGIEKMRQLYNPDSDEKKPDKLKEELQRQKDSAKTAIDNRVKEVQAAIDADNSLTNAEKKTQKQNAKTAADKAISAINDPQKAYDAQTIKNIHDQGLTDIESQHDKGIALSAQKQAAKDAIEQKEKEILSAIEKDVTLDDSLKSDMAKKVSSKAQEAKDNIDSKNNADDISKAKDEGITEMKKVYDPESPTKTSDKLKEELQRQKDSAKTAIDDKLGKVQAAIDADNSLTQSQKDTQKKNAKDIADNAKTAIDNPQKSYDAQTIKNIRDKALADIENQHNKGSEITAQKEVAKNAIEQKEKEILSAIEKDVTLDDNQKADLAAKVSGEAITAKNEIDGADNADAINKVKDNGIEKMKQLYNPDSDEKKPDKLKEELQRQRDVAKTAIDNKLKKVQTAIDADNSLTNAEKETQKQNAKTAADKAISSINDPQKAYDSQTIKNIGDQGLIDIESQHNKGIELSAQKETAKNAIEQKEKETLSYIERDNTLDNHQKSVLAAAVSKAAQDAKDNIDKEEVDNAEKINVAKETGIKSIDDIYKPKSEQAIADEVDSQKAKAIDEITKLSEKIKKDIDEDPSLTKENKEAQKDLVERTKQTINQSITNDAYDAQTINDIKTLGKDSIISLHDKGDLGVEKKNALESIDAYEASALIDIEKDTTLNHADKQNQIKAVQHEAEKARKAIEKAENAEIVNGVLAKAIIDIPSHHKSNSDNTNTENSYTGNNAVVNYVPDYGVQVWTIENGKPVAVKGNSSHIPTGDKIKLTEESKMIDGIKYLRVAGTNQWIQAQYTEPGTFQPVHYVPGYGVRIWSLDNNIATPLTGDASIIPSFNSVKIVGNEKMVDGDLYIQIGSASENRWIQKKYLESATYQPVHYVPGYGVRIWSLDSNTATPLTGDTSIIPSGNSIRVLGNEKTVDGDVYVQIGSSSENKWIQKKYLQTPVLKEVNYVKGYGVQNWKFNADGTTSAISGSYTPSNAMISTLDTRTFDGISYTRIGSAEQNVWVQTQYLV